MHSDASQQADPRMARPCDRSLAAHYASALFSIATLRRTTLETNSSYKETAHTTDTPKRHAMQVASPSM